MGDENEPGSDSHTHNSGEFRAPPLFIIKILAYLYRTDDTREKVTPKGEKFSLDELYELLKCELIEVVRLTPSINMIIDEEGKFTKSEINGAATFVAHVVEAIQPDDFIVGDVIVCNTEEFE